jgi:hypothetical protein
MTHYNFYKADFSGGDKFYKNIAFFPQEWSKEQVMQKVYTAYESFLKDGATSFSLGKSGRSYILGKISENIYVEIIMSKSGQVITAYPIFEK